MILIPKNQKLILENRGGKLVIKVEKSPGDTNDVEIMYSLFAGVADRAVVITDRVAEAVPDTVPEEWID